MNSRISSSSRSLAILDAQRQELFTACFLQGWQHNLEDGSKVQVVEVADWIEQLHAGDAVAGPPLEKLLDRLPAGVAAVDPEFWPPRAETSLSRVTRTTTAI